MVTPGQNEKYYLAGALHSGTGKVSYVGGNSKSSTLFISLLKRLKATYRRAKTITLIVGNYIIHRSRETQRWLKVQSHLSAGLLAMDESCGTAMVGTSRHNNAQSSVPLMLANPDTHCPYIHLCVSLIYNSATYREYISESESHQQSPTGSLARKEKAAIPEK